MQINNTQELANLHCVPCEGGIEPCTLEFSRLQLNELPAWTLSTDGKWIERKLRFKDFVQAVECLNKIAQLAEAEQHHPDLHLTGYRHLKVQFSTHAIGGLSENDFIMAAKVDALLIDANEGKV